MKGASLCLDARRFDGPPGSHEVNRPPELDRANIVDRLPNSMIAALFVHDAGPYIDRDGIDPWPESRDARLYAGPWPVVAHPPCQRWGRYAEGGPNARKKRHVGDDGGCFAAALNAVRTWGGVLEHPEASHAWPWFGLAAPPRYGGWYPADLQGGWTCCVEQGHYGHRARKATWLYVYGVAGSALPELAWGPSKGERMDEGFSSTAKRRAAREDGQKPLRRLSSTERLVTPGPFVEILLGIAALASTSRHETR